MITPKEMLDVLAMLEMAGIKPSDAIAGNMAGASKVYAAALADLTLDDVQAAALGYIRAPLPEGQFWKAWPDVGVLRQHVPARQIAAVDDSDEAWEHVSAIVARNAYREPPVGALDPESPARDAALRSALAAIGGAKGLGSSAESAMHHTRRTFIVAYRQVRERRRVAGEVVALRQISGPSGPPHLAVAPRGGGFKRLLEE